MKRDLMQRLEDGGVICAEGYLFELERRGYLQAGSFVPEVALEHPQALKQLHRDFLWAGSDVVEAFTYNGHREKMRIIGKEDLLEPLNRQALQIAREAAEEWDGESPLVAGNISNTNLFDPSDGASKTEVRKMFQEMVAWANEEGVDYVIGETFYYHGEASIALETIKAAGLPAVITLGLMAENTLLDGFSVEESCKRLKDDGADVVGLNCFRGPDTMMPYLEKIRNAVDGPVAGLPVPYRTTEAIPTFFNMENSHCHCPIPHPTAFPAAPDPFFCNRYEIRDWARKAYEMDVQYLGVCCGAAPIHICEVAEAIGRTPPASRYSPDMTKHFLFGPDSSLRKHMTDYAIKA